MTHRILCVEDDAHIGRLLVSLLEDAGYSPEWVVDGAQALQRWHAASLIMLDLSLPDMDGLAVCQTIREQDAACPILMLTARAGTQDVVRGLEIGADDYLTKPFDNSILLARTAALLRRRAQAESDSEAKDRAPIVAGDLVIDIDAHQARLGNEPLSLTAKEFALLSLFARHPGRGFTRAELLDAVWGAEFDGFDHTVNTHINRLRNKIEANAASPRYILTVWGVGYRFTDEAGA